MKIRSRRLMLFALGSGGAIAALLIALLFLEVLLRVKLLREHSFFTLPAEQRFAAVVRDARLGWRSNPDYRFEGQLAAADGTSYPCRISFSRNGFRRWDQSSTTPHILVLGDSYTHALEVSDGEEYFSVLGAALKMPIHAYGAGGYGPLQEAMILDEYLNSHRPALILWQLTPNDFVNLSWAIERRSVANNNNIPRPFLEGGEITQPRLPYPRWLKVSLDYSYAAYFLLVRWQRLLTALGIAGAIEEEIRGTGLEHQLLQQAADTLRQIFKRAVARAEGIPIYAFMADAPSADGTPRDGPYIEAARIATIGSEIIFLGPVSHKFPKGPARLLYLSADRAHWSPHGHRLVGEYLAEQLGIAAKTSASHG